MVTHWRAVMLLTTLALLLAVTVGRAEAASEDGPGPIVVVGSVLTNIVYLPGKLTYCILGAVTGGLAYGVTVGDPEVAQTIWDAGCRGTYVVTPRMLVGNEPIRFKGP